MSKLILKASLAGLVAGAACVSTSVAQTGAEVSEIRAQIEVLRAEQARAAEQQRRTDAALLSLEARLTAMTAASSAAANSPMAATATSGVATPIPAVTSGGATLIPAPRSSSPAVAPASAASRLQITGDLRLREQGDYSDSDGKDRNSTQLRGRLGAVFALNDRLTLGARLVTGDADDPNSTDVQLSNFDDDLQVSLDLAYAQLNFGNLKVTGGKIPQPFTRTDLVWDGDVNPQGLGATYRHALANGAAIRANGLYFTLDEQAAGPESAMTGAQIGYDSAKHGAWKYDVSAAYYDYALGSIAGGDTGDFRSNLRKADGTYLSDFNLGDVVIGASWSGAGERWPLRVVGDFTHNFGAEISADTAYGADLTLGRASQPGEWRVSYGYSQAQTDSVFAAFSHDNIGIATNYSLHALTFDYVPMSKTQISAIWYHYKPLDSKYAGGNAPGDWLERVRVFFFMSF
jgi:hypothetical protein